MPITDAEWASVHTLIEKKVADKGEPFVTDKVIKRDPDQRVIWTKDFGDEPIPVVAFNSFVRTFDSTASGISVRNVTGNAIVPEIGDTVLIARELGTRRLPRCLGVIGGNGLVPSEASLTDKPPPMAGGGGGGSVIYEQPNTPAEPVVMGSLWVDTDEQPPMWVAQIPLVSVLPSNPFDGQEIYYQSAAMAANGEIFHLRYRAASASGNKWESISGSKLVTQGVSGSTTSATPTPVGTGITVPLAGDYDVEWGGMFGRTISTEWNHIYMYAGDGTRVTQGLYWTRATTGAADLQIPMSGIERIAGIAAGAVWKHRIANSNAAGQVNLNGGWIAMKPVRVG